MSRSALTVAALTLCWAAPSLTAGAPPFPADKLAEAKKLVRDVFADEYAKAATDPAAGQALAKTLLQQSREIHDEPDVRHVALTEARDLAAKAGDAETAFAAIDELTKLQKDVDVAGLRADALDQAAAAALPPAEAQKVAELAFRLANEAGDLDRYDLAVRLGRAAAAAARRADNEPLADGIARRNAALELAGRETKRLEPFAAVLDRNPDDPQANLEVGRSWCFARDRWEKGLPHLAKGADPVLRKLAAQDLGNPPGGAAQAALAAAWRDAAARQQGETRLQMLRRSFQWYRQAVAQLDGAERTAVEERLKELTQTLPARLRVTDVAVEVRRLAGHTGEVLGVAFLPGGRQALTCGADKTARLWDLLTGKQLHVFQGHVGPVLGVALSADGQRAATSGQDRTLRLWDVAGGPARRTLTGHDDFVNGVALSADGTVVASAGQDATVRLWDAGTGKELKQLRGHAGAVYRVAFAPDGRTLASCAADGTVRLWDAGTGKELKQLRGHSGEVLALAFAPDGGRLVTGGDDRTVRLWDANSGQEVRRFAGHTATVGAVAFAPDGLRFLSGGDDRTLRLWDAETGQALRTLTGHADAVYGVALSPDGRWALSCGLDGTVRLWGERR